MRRNHVSNVGNGISILADLNTTDNVFTTGVAGFSQSAIRTVAFNRNDVSGFTRSCSAVSSGGNYQCNWWGSATGPVLVLPSFIPMYTPFATTPIAGTATICP